MATFYVGYRNKLKGRNGNVVNPYTHKVGVYSNWSIFNTSHVLDGAPDKNHVPGEGLAPHGILYSRKFLGFDPKEPMDNAGNGARIVGARFRPLEYKGLTANAAMTNPGHPYRHNAFSWSHYSNYVYNGLSQNQALAHEGHGIRAIGSAGTANSFGYFSPWTYKGVTTGALKGGGKTLPAAGTDPYGHEHINEWAGVPSSRAL